MYIYIYIPTRTVNHCELVQSPSSNYRKILPNRQRVLAAHSHPSIFATTSSYLKQMVWISLPSNAQPACQGTN